MTAAPWVYDDGGRADAGYRGRTGDCGARAAAIGLGIPYRVAYGDLHIMQREWIARRRGTNRRANPAPSEGVFREVLDTFLACYGWEWTPTMSVGSGTRLHLAESEMSVLPSRCIVRLSRHFAAVVDGKVRDTHDPSRDGTRAVYGYWRPTDG